MPKFTYEQLVDIAAKVLVGIGANENDATIVAEHLAEANAMGHDSHGLIRLVQYHQHAEQGLLDVKATPEIERESTVTARMDGKWSWGQVIARKAVELAIAKATDHGLATIGVRNCYHVGRVGAHAALAAKAGFVGKVWCNGHGVCRVAPWGATEARLATNPIAVALPTSKDPIVIDITTSIVAEGKVRVAKNKGISIPDGWVLDSDGNPTNNPADLYEGGTLLPLGGSVGHKGYALSLLVDVLGGTLTGAGNGAMPGVPIGNGLLVELLDPEAIIGRAEYLSRIDAFIDYVRSAKPKAGVEEILLPGEPEQRMEAKRRREGIEIDDKTWADVNTLANNVGVALA